VVVLTDTDGDGRMDRRSVFMDGLVLPRAVAPTRGGALIIAPPELLFCWDTDGDGRADEKVVIETGLTAGLANPEHAINGLLPTMDGWFQCANYSMRYRHDGSAWISQRTGGGGQWGITGDETGRTFFNTNSDPLRGDLFPSWYAVRNPNHGRAFGVNLRLAKDMAVFPARITPGVNRGYRKGLLRDWKLSTFTGACGPLFFRGDALGERYAGRVFVSEPCANLVACFALESDGGLGLAAQRDRPRQDFLTSTDERFRPVHLTEGPDGSLVVVDMYRGLIQHRIYLTTFLRKQVDARGLAAPTGLGRIWRVSSANGAGAAQNMAEASWTDLVALLGHPSGWTRDRAREAILAEGDVHPDAAFVRGLLQVEVREGETPMGRLQALWTLFGLGRGDARLVADALGDPDQDVRIAAARVGEPLLARNADALLARYVDAGRSGDVRLRHQILLSLGEAESRAGEGRLLELAGDGVSDAYTRSAVLSGIGGRETRFLTMLLAESAWMIELPGRASFVRLLARAITREGRGDRIQTLLELAMDPVSWRRRALLSGIVDGRPPGPDGKPTYIAIPEHPAAFAAQVVADSTDERGREVLAALLWPGRGGVDVPAVRPLSDEEQLRFARGRTAFVTACAGCHLPSGLGEEGKAPALRYSRWVLGSDATLIRIVTSGMRGPVKVRGRMWNMEMPAYGASDEDLADILTYVRREWGHGADPITPARVAAVRADSRGHGAPWTAPELRQLETD